MHIGIVAFLIFAFMTLIGFVAFTKGGEKSLLGKIGMYMFVIGICVVGLCYI